MATATPKATRDDLFNALINVHQVSSDTDISSRTDMVSTLDAITQEILQVIPDADQYLETDEASDEDDSDLGGGEDADE